MHRINKNVLVTGATGFIGGELCLELAKAGYTVWALVRAVNQRNAEKRLIARLRLTTAEYIQTIHTVYGDMRLTNMGLVDSVRKTLSERCDYVIHAAGETRFNKPPQDYLVNIEGVKHLLHEISTWTSRPKIYYMSTASVNCAPEQSVLNEGCSFHGYANDYVLSKRKAECIVRESGLDVVCLRPSIVVSQGMQDPQLAREILWFVPIAFEVGMIPLDENTMLDIVPVDYVVKSIIELMKKDHTIHNCYHISAGSTYSVNCMKCFHIAAGYYGKKIYFVSRSEWKKQEQVRDKTLLVKLLNHYLPFINANIIYSNERIYKEIGKSMPSCTKLTEYLCDSLSLISKEDARIEGSCP